MSSIDIGMRRKVYYGVCVDALVTESDLQLRGSKLKGLSMFSKCHP
jgi:hypothetical protein